MCSSESSFDRANNPTLRSRFLVSWMIPELRGHKGVTLMFFHSEPLPEDLYREILAPLNMTELNEELLRSSVGETFSAEEVEVLRVACGKAWPEGEFLAEPCKYIAQNSIGVGMMGGGVGPRDYLMLDKTSFGDTLASLSGTVATWARNSRHPTGHQSRATCGTSVPPVFLRKCRSATRRTR